MAKRGKKRRSGSRRRARRGAAKQCCPIIQVRCKAVEVGKPKICTVRVGGSKARKMDSNKAGRFIGKVVRAQARRRCKPLVKGSAS